MSGPNTTHGGDFHSVARSWPRGTVHGWRALVLSPRRARIRFQSARLYRSPTLALEAAERLKLYAATSNCVADAGMRNVGTDGSL